MERCLNYFGVVLMTAFAVIGTVAVASGFARLVLGSTNGLDIAVRLLFGSIMAAGGAGYDIARFRTWRRHRRVRLEPRHFRFI